MILTNANMLNVATSGRKQVIWFDVQSNNSVMFRLLGVNQLFMFAKASSLSSGVQGYWGTLRRSAVKWVYRVTLEVTAVGVILVNTTTTNR